MAESKEWDVNEAVSRGALTMQEFADHGSEIVDALEAQKLTALITRRSKVVAVLVPMTLERLVERQLANDSELQATLEGATEAFQRGETRSATDFFINEIK